jgi:fluoroacetyl-CoA thioesterase
LNTTNQLKRIFKSGDIKQTSYVVRGEDIASFKGNVVHPVCATFTLAREIEWSTRQFVLDMREEDEEGVGTFLTIEHKAPAFVDEEIIFIACYESLTGNELICSFEAKVGGRVVATGKTGQKILKRETINRIFTKPNE